MASELELPGTFQDDLKRIFGVKARKVNFQPGEAGGEASNAREIVNRLVEDATDLKIKEIISEGVVQE